MASTSPREAVVFKGSKTGLLVLLDDTMDFRALKSELESKLARSQSFFQGAAVTVNVGSRQLTNRQMGDITALFAGYGLKLLSVTGRVDEPAAAPEAAQPTSRRLEPTEVLEERGSLIAGSTPPIDTLLVKRTLRSGQRLRFRGNVVVMGDVNAGAEVVAGGDIVVLGTLRGLAHAGAPNREDATVVALKLAPTQLRIGGVFSRSPDGDLRSAAAEQARVKNGRIIIERYTPSSPAGS